jgi:hypothetical protein
MKNYKEQRRISSFFAENNQENQPQSFALLSFKTIFFSLILLILFLYYFLNEIDQNG